ncbi:hypothetical protein AB0G02_09560 [Actinosynnema sp. NPDC023658]|uniref:hypothetical protein n=1 Tax=Actinosynnema sp. NPDC023658 TaxID=3155465 RepID=UPI00340764A2
MSTSDPKGWPALLHRLATSWPALLRLLLGVVLVVGIVTGALHALGDVRVEFGPFVVEHHGTPTLVVTSASAS